jgi:hypothetical protein
MIESAIDSRSLYREHIEIVFDEAEEVHISLCIRADLAVLISHIHHAVTAGTLSHIGMELGEGLGKIPDI